MLTSVSRALRIVEEISQAGPNGITVTQIGDLLSVPTPSVHHALKTLKQAGWITQDNESKRYRVSVKLWQIASAGINYNSILAAARPYMRTLLEETGETVYLGKLAADDLKTVVYLDRVDSPRSIQVLSEVGTRVPAYCSAIGKALLSAQPDLENIVESLQLKRFNDNTITEKPKLLADLMATRKRGFSLSYGEHSSEIVGVATPVRDHSGEAKFALGTSIPSYRFGAVDLDELSAMVLKAGRSISTALGYF